MDDNRKISPSEADYDSKLHALGHWEGIVTKLIFIPFGTGFCSVKYMQQEMELKLVSSANLKELDYTLLILPLCTDIDCTTGCSY